MRVLMLDIDGLQPAYLGPFGCEWVPTPTLDHWAAIGVVFDQHYADCPDPSAAPGWRSGRHPNAGDASGSDLIADLNSAGIITARVGPSRAASGWQIDVPTKSDAEPLLLKSIRRGIRAAIEQIGSAESALLRVEIDALLPPWRPSDEALADVFADSAHDEESDPLEPWLDELPASVASDDDRTFARIQNTYAAAVATFDSALAKLLADCKKCGWGDKATWILTSGRGFPLGEHSAVGFAEADVHEEMVHLPLMVRWPSAAHAGHRISEFTQPMDLAPTLRELFGLEIGPAEPLACGNSLASLAGGGDRTIREWAVSAICRAGRTNWGYRVPGWYLMLDDRAESARRLFVKPDDRWEANDVSSRNQDLVEEIEREFGERFPFRRAASGAT